MLQNNSDKNQHHQLTCHVIEHFIFKRWIGHKRFDYIINEKVVIKRDQTDESLKSMIFGCVCTFAWTLLVVILCPCKSTVMKPKKEKSISLTWLGEFLNRSLFKNENAITATNRNGKLKFYLIWTIFEWRYYLFDSSLNWKLNLVILRWNQYFIFVMKKDKYHIICTFKKSIIVLELVVVLDCMKKKTFLHFCLFI